jgi:hypothetical protein
MTGAFLLVESTTEYRIYIRSHKLSRNKLTATGYFILSLSISQLTAEKTTMATAALHAYFLEILPESSSLQHAGMKIDIVDDRARLPPSAWTRARVANMVQVTIKKRQPDRWCSLSPVSPPKSRPCRWQGSFTTNDDATRLPGKPLKMPTRCVSNEGDGEKTWSESAVVSLCQGTRALSLIDATKK